MIQIKVLSWYISKSIQSIQVVSLHQIFLIICFQLIVWDNQSLLYPFSFFWNVFLEIKNGGGVGGLGVHLSSKIHQEYSLRHRSACRSPAESGQEYLTSGKEYISPQKLDRMKELGAKTGVLIRLDLPLVGGGTEAGVQFPHWGNCLSQRRNI